MIRLGYLGTRVPSLPYGVMSRVRSGTGVWLGKCLMGFSDHVIIPYRVRSTAFLPLLLTTDRTPTCSSISVVIGILVALKA